MESFHGYVLAFFHRGATKDTKSKNIHGKPKLIQGIEPRAPGRTRLLCQEHGRHILRGFSMGNLLNRG
jgi:hypothetical protein